MTLIEQIIRDVSELEPSPSADESHDSMLVTASELEAILEKHLAPIGNDATALGGFSVSGVNVYGNHESIKAAMDWHHSHSTIESIRTNLRHWREECGVLHSKQNQMVDALKRIAEFPSVSSDDDAWKATSMAAIARAALPKFEGRS